MTCGQFTILLIGELTGLTLVRVFRTLLVRRCPVVYPSIQIMLEILGIYLGIPEERVALKHQKNSLKI